MTVSVEAADTAAIVARTFRRQGAMIMLLSALLFSTAGLFTKGVDAGAWSVIFWRGLFAAVFSTLYVVWRGSLSREFLGMGCSGLMVALASAIGTAAFISAFKLTSIANVALIYATGPLLAAALAWFWFRETPTRGVLIASLTALGGVAIIVSGSLGGVHLQGDLLALLMTLMLSVMMVIYRRHGETPAVGPMILSSLLLLPFAFWLDDPLAVPPDEIAVMAAFGIVFAIAGVTMLEGARRMPSAEAALISAIETPLAPVWAWLLFSTYPSIHTVIGGSIILIAVFGAQLQQIRRERELFKERTAK